MRTSVLVLALCGVVLLAAAPGPARAGSGGLIALLTVSPSGAVRVGDTVNVTLQVYEGGLRVPTTSASVSTAGVDLPLVEDAPGLLRGVYIVRADHLSPEGAVRLRAEVAANRERAQADVALPVLRETSGVLRIEMALDDPDDWTPRPGDLLELRVLVYLGGNRTDPDLLTLTVRTATGEGIAEEVVPTTHEAQGLFAGTHEVDPANGSGASLLVTAVATLGNESAMASIPLSVVLAEVWALALAPEGDGVGMTLCASDRDGLPVSGAFLRFDSPGGAVAVTDGEGRARVHVPLEPDGRPWLLKGGLTLGGRTQPLAAIIPVIVGGATSQGWRLTWVGEGGRVAPSEDLVAQYRVLNGTVPWGPRYVHYYAEWEPLPSTGAPARGPSRGLLAAGNHTTDALGDFAFTLDLPAEEGLVHVVVFAPERADDRTNDGWAYARLESVIPVRWPVPPLPMGDVPLELGAFPQGGPLRVSVPASGEVTLTWSLQLPDALRLTPPRPLRLSGQSAEIALPGCLPTDAAYAVTAEVRDPATGRVLRAGAARTADPPPLTGGPAPALVTLAVLLTGTAVVGFALRRHARGRRGPRAEPPQK